MDQVKLCETIKDKLSCQGIELTDEDIANLYFTTIASIENVLEEGDTLTISNFGSFWRKKGMTSSITFFKPSEELSGQIN